MKMSFLNDHSFLYYTNYSNRVVDAILSQKGGVVNG